MLDRDTELDLSDFEVDAKVKRSDTWSYVGQILREGTTLICHAQEFDPRSFILHIWLRTNSFMGIHFITRKGCFRRYEHVTIT